MDLQCRIRFVCIAKVNQPYTHTHTHTHIHSFFPMGLLRTSTAGSYESILYSLCIYVLPNFPILPSPNGFTCDYRKIGFEISVRFCFFFFFRNDFYCFYYSWFTVFCQFSTVQPGDPGIHIYTLFFSHCPPSCSIISGIDMDPCAIQQDLIAHLFQRE